MSSRPWYKWYPGDYLADTQMLSLEESGAYRALLDHLWTCGPVDPTERNLGAIWRVDRRKVRRIYAVLRPYLDETSGLVDHPKIAKQRAESLEVQEKRRKSGKKGGAASATNARARDRTRTRGPDPDPDKDLPRVSAFPLDSPAPAPARESRGLSPDQRAAAEALQRDLEQRRAALSVVPAYERHVGEVAAECGKAAPGGAED